MPLEWFPASSVPHRLGAGQWRRRRSDCWTAGHSRALQPQPWLRRCSLDISYQRVCAAWEKAAKGPAVSIPGWMEPWLTRSRAGESPAFPGGLWKCCTFRVPGIRWGQLQPSAQPQCQRRHKDPDVVTGPEPVKRSMWPPQPGTAAPGLNIHGHRTRAVTTSSPTDSSFPHIQKPWESALYHTACQMFCCWAVLTPILL